MKESVKQGDLLRGPVHGRLAVSVLASCELSCCADGVTRAARAMAEAELWWLVSVVNGLRCRRLYVSAGANFVLGRDLVGAANTYVSRQQAVLRPHTIGNLLLESRGHNTTRVCQAHVADDWAALREGETMELSSGARIALDKNLTPDSQFLLYDHSGFVRVLATEFLRGLQATLPSAPTHADALNRQFLEYVTNDVSSPTGTNGRNVQTACLEYLQYCLRAPEVFHGFEQECHHYLGYFIAPLMEARSANLASGSGEVLTSPQPEPQTPLVVSPPPPPPPPQPKASTPLPPPPHPSSVSTALPASSTVSEPSLFDRWLAQEQSDRGIELDIDQRRVVELVCVHGRNVFYTGSGGVGKSLVTKFIIAFLKFKYQRDPNVAEDEQVKFEDAVAVVASTGIAASHVGGTTLHSALGIGVPGNYDDFRKMWGQKDKMRKFKVMLIDEVSMLAGELFDKVDDMLRRVRHWGRYQDRGFDAVPPFGGIQLVCCGDFFQLPPIEGAVPRLTWPRLLDEPRLEHRAVFLEHRNQCEDGGGCKRKREPADICDGCVESEVFLGRGFAFQSDAWWFADFVCVELCKVYRQEDEQMVSTLNAIRKGEATEQHVAWLNDSCCTPPRSELAMQIAPFKRVVAKRNSDESEALTAKGARPYIWMARDGATAFDGSDTVRSIATGLGKTFFEEDCPAEKRTTLVEGARVMLLVNLDLDADGQDKLVNGSLGTFLRPSTNDEAQDALETRVEELNNMIKLLRQRVDEVGRSERSRSLLMERVQQLEQELACLRAWVSAHPNGRDYSAGGCWQGPRILPFVRFDNKREIALLPSLLTSEIVGQGVCSRMQIPCKMAWAVTIHKSQGMTLDAGAVQTAGSFSDGMAYVALSRVKTLKGLRLRRPCQEGLSCVGCEGCRCALTLAQLATNADVASLDRAYGRAACALASLAEALRGAGSRQLASTLLDCGPVAAQQLLQDRNAIPAALRDAALAALLPLATPAERWSKVCPSWRSIAPKQEPLREDQA